jgi:hypothetical protein
MVAERSQKLWRTTNYRAAALRACMHQFQHGPTGPMQKSEQTQQLHYDWVLHLTIAAHHSWHQPDHHVLHPGHMPKRIDVFEYKRVEPLRNHERESRQCLRRPCGITILFVKMVLPHPSGGSADPAGHSQDHRTTANRLAVSPGFERNVHLHHHLQLHQAASKRVTCSR